MDIDQKMIPGLEVIKTHSILVQSQELMQNCLDLMEPTDKHNEMIIMGLTWKLIRLHRPVLKNLLIIDNMTMAILLRVFYETSLTIRYMLKKNDPKIYKEFIKTDAIRKKQLVEFYRESGSMNQSQLSVFETRNVLEILKDNIDYSKLKTKKAFSTWYRGVSYFEMANELERDDAEIHTLLYGGTSLIMHPSWTDVKTNLLVKDPRTKKYSPNKDEALPVNLNLTMLACQSLTASRYLSLSIVGGEDLYKSVENLHKKLHKSKNEIAEEYKKIIKEQSKTTFTKH